MCKQCKNRKHSKFDDSYMVTEISISENFLEKYLPRATIEILPPLPCDNFYLPNSGRHVTSVHQSLSQADAGEEPGYEVGINGQFFNNSRLE